AARPEPSRFQGHIVGICVVGRRLLGTTRLAWEALKHTPSLGTWVFVRWPENPRQYVELWQALQQHRAKVVLWLDDLSAYRDDRNASLITHIPYDLEERGIPFVILATLAEETVAEETQARFGGLLKQLEPIHPSKLSIAEANELVSKLTEAGASVSRADR